MRQMLTKMMICLALVLGVIMVVPPVSAALKAHLMVPVAKHNLLSYEVEDANDKLWTAIQDGVRAGRQVMVAHTIKIKPAGWLHRSIETKTVRKFMIYNLFENAYSYGANEQVARRTTRPELVKAYAFGLEDQPFVARHKLVPGKTYTITVTIEVTEKSEEESWLRYLPLQNLFKQRLTRSFTYVAQ